MAIVEADSRHIVFPRCQDHPVASCADCGLDWYLSQLRAEWIGALSYRFCPMCGRDLIDSIREHVRTCRTGA